VCAPGHGPAPATSPLALAAALSDGDTRNAYLRAATRLVNEHGYHGASVDRIAAELQLTKGSFYHHHETKEELIAACFERTFAVVRAAQSAALDAPARAAAGWRWPAARCWTSSCRRRARCCASPPGPACPRPCAATCGAPCRGWANVSPRW
jgi:AcrR family transcriptional regulator